MLPEVPVIVRWLGACLTVSASNKGAEDGRGHLDGRTSARVKGLIVTTLAVIGEVLLRWVSKKGRTR